MAEAANSRRPKKTVKKKPAVASKKIKTSEKPRLPAVLPSVWQLCRRTAGILKRHYKLFGAVTLVYAALYALFVQGLGKVQLATSQIQAGNQTSGAFNDFAKLFSASNSGAAQAYQLLLFFIASLAVIWCLRNVKSDITLRARDAFYRGMHPLVPTMLVSLVISVQLVPLLIGANMYQLVTLTGIASNSIQQIMWGAVALGLALVSLYFLAASLQAFYIVTLPDMTPLQALRSARTLVKGRRWTIIRKALVLPLIIGLLYLIVLVPAVIVVPVIAPWLLAIVGASALTISHSYLYTLYRSLLDEQ